MGFAGIIGPLIVFLSLVQNPPAMPPSSQSSSQQESQTSDQQPPATPQRAPASKPCSASPQPDASHQPDCKPSKHKKSQKTQSPPMPGSGPTKTVVHNGSTADPTVEISSGLSPQQAAQQLKRTNQLLAATEVNLKRIATHQLSSAQEESVRQIKTYMEQARMAANTGDVQRAHNLANKANMLAADLARQ
jgi:hypothetical protein